jgi:hypothetical protein
MNSIIASQDKSSSLETDFNIKLQEAGFEDIEELTE